MDLDGDGFLDLVTINDGEIVGENSSSRREHVFRNDGKGRFRDATDAWWPPAANVGEDDNMVAFLDYRLRRRRRLRRRLAERPRSPADQRRPGPPARSRSMCSTATPTPGTLGLALADLDGDGRMDVVQAQGEHPKADRRARVLGPRPRARHGAAVGDDGRHARRLRGRAIVRARVHDRKSPSLPTEWKRVVVEWTGAAGRA